MSFWHPPRKKSPGKKRYCQALEQLPTIDLRRGRRNHGYAARRPVKKGCLYSIVPHMESRDTPLATKESMPCTKPPKRSKPYEHSSFRSLPIYWGKVKLTVTQIQAGTQHNVIPARCDFVVDVRTNDRYTNAEAVEILKSRFPEVKIAPRSLRLNSSAISMQHPFVRRALLAGYKPFVLPPSPIKPSCHSPR